MKRRLIRIGSLLLLGMLSPVCQSQDKPKSEEKPRSEAQITPVKATIVFTEYEGDKKIKSLPYSIYMNAPASTEPMPGWAKLRIGNRVPVYAGQNQFTYLDVGTNIDARASRTLEGSFRLYLNLERSSVENNVDIPVQKAPENVVDPNRTGSFGEPVVRQFRSELDLKIREGQVLESTMATDPVSGKVLKVEVSVTTLK
ncbi:MAG TPA: hypothetical protein VGR55_07885 [Candidatus Acidoferrum sp.]|nr:hypothetical protein [Candidatus Acidoferrum sp.]